MQQGLPVGPTEQVAANASDRTGVKDSNDFGQLNEAEVRAIGEFYAGNSQRILRGQFEQWSSQHRLRSAESRLVSEELALRGLISLEGAGREEENGAGDAISLNVGTVVSTAIGTGAILWVIQATQLAATFVSAAAPTWMQIDIASAMKNIAKENCATDEASAKIFE